MMNNRPTLWLKRHASISAGFVAQKQQNEPEPELAAAVQELEDSGIPPVKDFSTRVKTISKTTHGNSRSVPRCVHVPGIIVTLISQNPVRIIVLAALIATQRLNVVLLRKPLLINLLLRNLTLLHISGHRNSTISLLGSLSPHRQYRKVLPTSMQSIDLDLGDL